MNLNIDVSLTGKVAQYSDGAVVSVVARTTLPEVPHEMPAADLSVGHIDAMRSELDAGMKAASKRLHEDLDLLEERAAAKAKAKAREEREAAAPEEIPAF